MIEKIKEKRYVFDPNHPEINSFLPGSQIDIFFKSANVDENGYSDPVMIKDHPELQNGNGCGWGRSDGPLGKKYNVKRITSTELYGYGGNSIVAVKLMGLNEKYLSDRTIPNIIKENLKGKPCIITGVRSGKMEADHKNGRYNKYNERPSRSIKDYQPMGKSSNDAKRTHCNKCIDTNIRFDAKILGYKYSQWIGDEEYHSCVGCYWYDPIEFNRKISENYQKTR